jgi:membrane protein
LATFRAMPIRQTLHRLRDIDWDVTHWMRKGLSVAGKALTRLWGRDVMLYTGGVSFFVMLAIFPAVAILIGLYSLLSDPSQATLQAESFANLMPPGARALFESELLRLASAPRETISTQSGIALIIGAYASHRGFKALLAGLSFIHEEDEQRGFVSFNLMALVVLIAAFVMLGISSSLFFGLRMVAAAFHFKPLAGVSWLASEWTWSSIGLTVAMTLIYRYAMSSKPVAWTPSAIGGFASAILCLGASWASAVYVEQIAQLGATYGSIATVVVFLIWLSWNVNAIFFGGALATEAEIAIEAGRGIRAPSPIES